MKTRKIISALRVIVERVALLMVLTVITVYMMQQCALLNVLQNYWYIGAALLFGYAALTLGEDYLNYRIINHGFKI